MKENIAQWRAVAGRIESVDLRFNREAVVNPGPTVTTHATKPAPKPAAKTAVPLTAKPLPKLAAKHSVKPASKHAAKHKPA